MWINMKKISLPIFGLLFAFSLLIGCDKADIKVKKLYHGDGTWTIESIHYEYYDSTGKNIIHDSTLTDVGEMIFFRTTTLNALWDYHFVVINLPDASGIIHAYTGEVFFDESRVHFGQDANLSPFPGEFMALWSVNNSNRHKQEWSKYQLRGDGTLDVKTTIALKKK
jgi:hypothetical protein